MRDSSGTPEVAPPLSSDVVVFAKSAFLWRKLEFDQRCLFEIFLLLRIWCSFFVFNGMGCVLCKCFD